MIPCKQIGRRVLLALVACAALAPAAVRADGIDQGLRDKASQVLQHLQKKGYKNVGVFRFMVKKGKGEPSFTAGELNDNLAIRLENALILADDPKNPLGIIHDATTTAAKLEPKFTYRTPEGRQQLFKPSYPLAWGSQKVTADAFLTGLATISADNKEITIEIGAFDKQSAKVEDILKFKIDKVDRTMLTDIGQSFVVKRSLVNRRDIDEVNQDASASATSLDEVKPGQPNPLDGLLKLEVMYNGTAQTLAPGSAGNGGEWKLPEPMTGATVTIRMTNQTADRLGVVLKVNGKSLIDMEEQAADSCKKWVLEGNKSVEVKGFYFTPASEGEKPQLDPFKVVDSLEGSWNPDHIGFISCAVFREGPAVDDPQISLRGLSRRAVSRGLAAKTLADAKEHITQASKAAAAATKSRGFIGQSGAKADIGLKVIEVTGWSQAANLQIRYKEPQ